MAILGRRRKAEPELPDWEDVCGNAARDRSRVGLGGSWAVRRRLGERYPAATGEQPGQTAGGARNDMPQGGMKPNGSATVR